MITTTSSVSKVYYGPYNYCYKNSSSNQIYCDSSNFDDTYGQITWINSNSYTSLDVYIGEKTICVHNSTTYFVKCYGINMS